MRGGGSSWNHCPICGSELLPYMDSGSPLRIICSRKVSCIISNDNYHYMIVLLRNKQILYEQSMFEENGAVIAIVNYIGGNPKARIISINRNDKIPSWKVVLKTESYISFFKYKKYLAFT